MQDSVRVEIVPRTVDADLSDPMVVGAARDLDKARESGNTVGIAAAQDAYVLALRAATKTAWFARLGGVEVPLETFEIQPPDNGGQALVSLLIAADSVQVGDPAASPQTRPAAPEQKPPMSTWGPAGKSDPRESIPGWKPQSLGEQVAGNAARVLA